MSVSKKILVFVSLSTLIFLFQNCSEFESATSNSIATISNFNAIDTNVISVSCASCHSGPTPQGGIDLSTYAAIIASGTVTAGNAEASTFYTEILSGDMPPGDEVIDPLYVQAIKAWIDNGASENEAPTVSAGDDLNLVLPVTSTNLVADASDIDGSIASYAWTQMSGPNSSSLSGEDTATVTVSNLIIGTYLFQVIVTDDFGDQASDIVQVVLTDAPNVPPNVNAGNDRIIDLPTSSTTISANATDSDGSIVSYLWTQTSGPNTASLSGDTTASLTASSLIEGTYTFNISVTDDDGASDNDSINVTVAPPAPTLTQLRTNIFDTKCAGCHLGGGSFGGYSMDTYSGLMTKVVASNANGSVFYTEVRDEEMPTNSNKLTQTEKDQVRDWINAGALNN